MPERAESPGKNPKIRVESEMLSLSSAACIIVARVVHDCPITVDHYLFHNLSKWPALSSINVLLPIPNSSFSGQEDLELGKDQVRTCWTMMMAFVVLLDISQNGTIVKNDVFFDEKKSFSLDSIERKIFLIPKGWAILIVQMFVYPCLINLFCGRELLTNIQTL